MVILFLVSYFLLHYCLPPEWFLFGVRPDLLLLLVIFWGLFDLRRGVILALAAGLFKDASSGGIFGLNTFCFCLWFILARRTGAQIYKDNKFVYLALVISATAGNYLLFLSFNGLLRRAALPPLPSLFLILLIEAIYNSLCGWWLFSRMAEVVRLPKR
ncbi:MAG: rod shape-determining protein MreD [Candidatus Omnitrophota bacterium]